MSDRIDSLKGDGGESERSLLGMYDRGLMDARGYLRIFMDGRMRYCRLFDGGNRYVQYSNTYPTHECPRSSIPNT